MRNTEDDSALNLKMSAYKASNAEVSARKESRDVRLIQSVDRALSIVEVLASKNNPLNLNKLAEAVGLNVSTCHHLVATLVTRGYVLHAGRGRGYMLSSKLGELTALANQEFDIADFVRPDLEQLNADLRESVQMAVLHGSALITQVRFPSLIPTHVEPDELRKTKAAHATATGKAILAWLPEAELVRVATENGLTAYTDKTITTLSGLIEELRLVRRSGFAVDDEELEPDVVCIGAAVRDGAGAVIGSLSVSMPKGRASADYRSYITNSVVQCAKELSDRLRVGHF